MGLPFYFSWFADPIFTLVSASINQSPLTGESMDGRVIMPPY